MTVLHHGRDDGRKRRDAIILAFREAKLSVLEFDDSTHSLRTRFEMTNSSSKALCLFYAVMELLTMIFLCFVALCTTLRVRIGNI